MTTRYDTEVISEKLNYVVGATFIDAFTIAVGNTSGRLIYAQLGMTAQPPELHVGSRSQGMPIIFVLLRAVLKLGNLLVRVVVQAVVSVFTAMIVYIGFANQHLSTEFW
jgi:hypothetical protein